MYLATRPKVFKSARIKLTVWYLLIIMTLTLSLSIFVYNGVVKTTEAALVAHQTRLERRLKDFGEFNNAPPRFQEPISEETVKEVRRKTLYLLFFLNCGVLVIAGGLGYFLAGKTLDPIEKMVEKQKRFIADATHELKTPLTAIKTQLEVTQRNKDLKVEDAKEMLDSVIEDVDELNVLVNALLKESRYQNGENGYKVEIINLTGLIKETVKWVEPKATAKDIKLITNIENIELKGDAGSLKELFTVLLDNAIKFTPSKGRVTISTKKTGKKALIEVKDTGSGISEKDLPYIFDRFYKADISRTKSTQEGFGLGLSIAKEIADKHKGKITVTSTLGKGSIFTITLPVS